MRRAIFSIGFPAVAGLVILSVCNCSCRRLEQPNLNNPVEQPLPAAKFAVTLCEEERGVVADSVYRFIATVSAPADDGKGADLRHYELKAVKDGSGIRVRAANSVPVEGFEVKFDGRLFSLVPKDFRYTLNSINIHDCTIGELPNVAYPYEHFEETLIEIGEHTELMPFEELYDMSRVKESRTR